MQVYHVKSWLRSAVKYPRVLEVVPCSKYLPEGPGRRRTINDVID